MKKRYLAAAGIIVSLALAGCTVNDTEVKNVDVEKAEETVSPAEEEVTEMSGEETQESAEEEVSAEGEAPVANEEEASEISGEGDLSKYEDILNVTVKAVIDLSGETASYYAFKRALSEGKEYTLTEIIDNLKQFMENDFWQIRPDSQGIEYAYIDCGNDGVKELLILLHLPVENEDFDVRMVVKDIGGTLTVVYDNDSWSRSETIVNEYGYVIGGGSGGASSEVSEYGVIDKDGKFKYIYGVDYENGELGYIWFEPEYEKRTTYYTYDPGFTTDRMKVVTKAEAEDMIKKRTEEANISDEIKNGKEPAMTKLEE